MENERILKSCECDCSSMPSSDQMMAKKMALSSSMQGMKNPYPEAVSAEKKEPAHGILNEIQEITDQIGRLSEDIRIQLMGPVPQTENSGGCTYRLKDRLDYERRKLYVIRGILQEVRDSL